MDELNILITAIGAIVLLAVLLGLVMPMMWAISGLLVYWILKIPFWEAMLVGTAITPTDPIVSTSIVTGVVAEDNLPERLRKIK